MTENTYHIIRTISYDYCDGEADSFDKLNNILSELTLTDLKLSEFRGHLRRRITTSGRKVYCYVPDCGKLTCTISNDGYIYRIDTVVEPTGDSEGIAERWRNDHPDRAMRTHIMLGYGELYCHIIFHHPRITEPDRKK